MTRDSAQTTYRKADVGDIEALTRLRLSFLAGLSREGDDPARLTRAITDYLGSAIPAGHYVAYLAASEGRPVGTGGMVIYELPPSGGVYSRRVGCIVSMFTMPELRRKGIARNILGLLIAEGREIGLSRIHLRATEEGIGLYRKYGFSEPRFAEMELSLDPPPPAR